METATGLRLMGQTMWQAAAKVTDIRSAAHWRPMSTKRVEIEAADTGVEVVVQRRWVARDDGGSNYSSDAFQK